MLHVHIPYIIRYNYIHVLFSRFACICTSVYMHFNVVYIHMIVYVCICCFFFFFRCKYLYTSIYSIFCMYTSVFLTTIQQTTTRWSVSRWLTILRPTTAGWMAATFIVMPKKQLEFAPTPAVFNYVLFFSNSCLLQKKKDSRDLQGLI